MAVAIESLKASEAAFVSRISIRDVNRAIDEHILSDGLVSLDHGRHLHPGACAALSFYYETADRLTATARLNVLRELDKELLALGYLAKGIPHKSDWIIRDDWMTIDVVPFVERAQEALAELAQARDMVTASDDILGGVPTIKGTRVPVYDVAASIAAGISLEKVLDAYPALDAKAVRLASTYAAANPLRGRPRKSVKPEGAQVLVSKRVPRRADRA